MTDLANNAKSFIDTVGKQMIFKNILIFVALFGWLSQPSWAEVALPNGNIGDTVVDLRVKVLGGYITIERQFDEGRWWINRDWEPAELGGQPNERDGCRTYPELTAQDRSYSGDGQVWTLENRYSVRAIGFFEGTGCAANRLKTLRWQDRNTGNWAEYQRSEVGSLRFRLIRHGDRNNVQVSFDYDADGRLQAVRDHFGNLVLDYLYTGTQLTEIRDNPDLIPGNTNPARSVRYHYSGTLIDQVTDVRGYITRYGYDSGKLASITDPENRVRRFEYLADRVAKEIDAEGRETRYVYDYDKQKKQFYTRLTNN